jgi:spermidine/putrescine-binding protein
MNRWFAAFLAITTTTTTAAAVMLAGCKGDSGKTSGSPATTQASGPAALNVYIWSEYLPKSVVDRFAERTGIPVTVDVYGNNEEILQKLQSGVADYDIVVPSDYMVRTLIHEKLVQPIDKSKLPHLSNIDPKFLDQEFDKGNAHSVPYLWGLTGLGYNKTKVEGTVDSWDVLFDERYKNQICMLDDPRECFAVALRRMGKSINETDPMVLAQAAEMLKKQMPLVKLYNSDDFAGKLAAGDVWVSHGYTGQLAKLAHQDPRFVVVMPKEGGTVSVDNLCIPASSKRADIAHKFIDFVLEPENAAEIANGTVYASPNVPAKKLINPELLKDPNIYPPDDVLKRCEFMRDVGDATPTYERLWTEVKGG